MLKPDFSSFFFTWIAIICITHFSKLVKHKLVFLNTECYKLNFQWAMLQHYRFQGLKKKACLSVCKITYHDNSSYVLFWMQETTR